MDGGFLTEKSIQPYVEPKKNNPIRTQEKEKKDPTVQFPILPLDPIITLSALQNTHASKHGRGQR